MSDILSHYSHHGFESDGESDRESLQDAFLEDSWTDVINEVEGMTRREKIQQEAIWELLITERNYLRKLRVIMQVLMMCMMQYIAVQLIIAYIPLTQFHSIYQPYFY